MVENYVRAYTVDLSAVMAHKLQGFDPSDLMTFGTPSTPV